MSQKSPSNLTREIASERLTKLRAELGSATLMAVSKYSESVDVEIYYHLGQLDYGENRVSELESKAIHFQNLHLTNIRWHFIGNIQRNKIKRLLDIPNLVAIHSVARTEILDELIKHADRFQGQNLDLYLEVNLGGEAEKHGFTGQSEVREVIVHYQKLLPHSMRLKGLMAMAPIRTKSPTEDAKRCFSELAQIASNLSLEFQMDFALSMGMSSDYKVALECGSNIVRIGSYLFK